MCRYCQHTPGPDYSRSSFNCVTNDSRDVWRSNNKVMSLYGRASKSGGSSVYEQRVRRRSSDQRSILFFSSTLSSYRKLSVNPRRRPESHLRQYIIIINNNNICYIFTATQIQRRTFPVLGCHISI